MWSPQPTANSICIKNIASVLKQRGWAVYINAFEGTPRQESETIDGIHIAYTRPALSRQLMTRAMFTADSRKKGFFRAMGIFLNRVTRIICMPCYPIAAPIFAKRWSRNICKQVRENDIDVIVSVNAPLDSIAAGYLVKKACPKVNWVAYYIDGGSNYGKEQTFLAIKKKMQKKSVRWENRVLSDADKIIVMEGHSAFYTKELSTSNRSRLEVLNVPLFDVQQLRRNEKPRKSSDKEIWTYTGTISSSFSDPGKLFSWFLQYSNHHRAELHMYGSTNMDAFLEAHCDHKSIFYHGLIPHDRVDSILSHSDVLVYFRSERLDSVSGKFFEYLMYRKPIVYFGPKDDINWRQLEKYPLGLAIDQDTGEQTKAFDTVFSDGVIPTADMLESIFYMSTPDAFADALDGIGKVRHDIEVR